MTLNFGYLTGTFVLIGVLALPAPGRSRKR